jgi:hypothetical protein
MTQRPNTPAHPTHGRVPVVVYIASDDPATGTKTLAVARRFASDREWSIVAEPSDTSTTAPLLDRHGWATVTAALATGSARGVVVGAFGMVATEKAEFEALEALIRDRGGFLVEATSTLPRRTPGQALRRRNLADAAAGYEGCGTEWDAFGADVR